MRGCWALNNSEHYSVDDGGGKTFAVSRRHSSNLTTLMAHTVILLALARGAATVGAPGGGSGHKGGENDGGELHGCGG